MSYKRAINIRSFDPLFHNDPKPRIALRCKSESASCRHPIMSKNDLLQRKADECPSMDYGNEGVASRTSNKRVGRKRNELPERCSFAVALATVGVSGTPNAHATNARSVEENLRRWTARESDNAVRVCIPQLRLLGNDRMADGVPVSPRPCKIIHALRLATIDKLGNGPRQV